MSDTDGKILIDKKHILDVSLPSYDNLEFSFFTTRSAGAPMPQLPPPEEVLQRNSDRVYGVVKYEELNLFVKYGGHTQLRIEGAVAMHAIRQTFSKEDLPVSELLGWRTYDGKSFIYMELMSGITLEQAWPDLTQDEKTSIEEELKRIVAKLRSIKQPEGRVHIGSLDGGPVQDNFFRDYDRKDEGPHSTVFDFNNAVMSAAIPWKPLAERKFKDPYRHLLRDDYDVFFSHGDLNASNIMVKGSKHARSISGILDWDQAGWYPEEYWEHCKVIFGVDYEHEWRTKGHHQRVTGDHEDELLAVAEYPSWRGVV